MHQHSCRNMRKRCSNKFRMFYSTSNTTQHHILFCTVSDSSLGHSVLCFKCCFISGTFESKIFGNAHVSFNESAHVLKIHNHWMVSHEIWYWGVYLKFVDSFSFWLHLESSSGGLTWGSLCFSAHILSITQKYSLEWKFFWTHFWQLMLFKQCVVIHSFIHFICMLFIP